MEPLSVVVVDDHEPFRSAACDLLRRCGVVVVGEARDGRGACELVERVRPDLLILDVRLPDLDGFEVTRRLTGSSWRPRIVLVSTREAIDFGHRVEESGADGFITKSRLSGATLQAILRDASEVRR